MSDRRRLQGAVLLLGALVFYVLLERRGIGFHWTPLVLGCVYLVAAALGGPRGSYWSTAVVLVLFGLGPVAVYEYDLDVTAPAAYVVCLGLAVLLAAQLEQRGVAVTPTAVGGTILALGVVYALQSRVDAVENPLTYAVALAAVGTARVVAGGGHRRRPRR